MIIYLVFALQPVQDDKPPVSGLTEHCTAAGASHRDTALLPVPVRGPHSNSSWLDLLSRLSTTLRLGDDQDARISKSALT